MIKKVYLLFFCFALTFCLSSCFEIVEEVSVKNDGSGDMLLTVNMSQSRSKLASIMLLDSIQGHKVPTGKEIRDGLEEAAGFLRESEGISRVEYSLDLDNYIANIRFSFDHVSDINLLTREVLKKNAIETSGVSSFAYDRSEGLFIREYRYDPKGEKEYLKLKEADQAVFREATYTNIYRFGKTVLNYTNKAARLSKSGKAIMFRCSLEDLITGKAGIGNRITLSE